MRKSAYVFPWRIPQQLVKVIVTGSHVSSDSPFWINSQDILHIPLSGIEKIKRIISTGQNATLEIITHESNHYLLVPINPLDPTSLSHSNVDEAMTFIDVVDALRNNRLPAYNENPYIRQFSKKDKPAYLDDKMDFLWDKNISPWEYYYQFVPENIDKKKRLMAKVYEIVVLGALSIMILITFYAIYVQIR
jgi:hypothetical protein